MNWHPLSQTVEDLTSEEIPCPTRLCSIATVEIDECGEGDSSIAANKTKSRLLALLEMYRQKPQVQRDQKVAARDHEELKYRWARGEGRATEEWGAAVLEDRTATTDGSQKEKRSQTAERTSRCPRRRNTNLPATLEEKRGNHRCILGTKKKSQWEDGRRREQEPRASGGTGGEGNKNQGGVGGRKKKGKINKEKHSTESLRDRENHNRLKYPAVGKAKDSKAEVRLLFIKVKEPEENRQKARKERRKRRDT
ncbi:hypothetical protein NDU88_007395 [Pleurodeles waltl]|uniref:Uncharacterized protein n=1 Tax=Pleurodeles waltl TaxID=8319 RepID=A0AAV7MGT2_PLEWA|nr:hypothetical protein NDU88_007395 [Pleurodeles waltl]